MIQYDQLIQYGDVKHAGEFQKLHQKAKEVAYVTSFLAKTLFNEMLITTSVFRKKTDDSGIHEAYRAIDFRPLKNISDTYRLIEIVNSIYTYDPQRTLIKVIHPNPFHGTGCHIHLQVHDNTVFMTNPHLVDLLAQASKDQSGFKKEFNV